MAYRVALRLCGNHHDAQDIAQEALIAAWETWTGSGLTRRSRRGSTRS
jgi:DNA-directed RNA polymerase specialized sigma24 family protein